MCLVYRDCRCRWHGGHLSKPWLVHIVFMLLTDRRRIGAIHTILTHKTCTQQQSTS